MSYASNAVAVLVGGAVGAVCRFHLNAAIMSGLTTRFPIGILIINVLGGFLMGLLQGWMKRESKRLQPARNRLSRRLHHLFHVFARHLQSLPRRRYGLCRAQHPPERGALRLRGLARLPHDVPHFPGHGLSGRPFPPPRRAAWSFRLRRSRRLFRDDLRPGP